MRYMALRCGLVAAVVGGTAAPAPAFYWVGWPGSGTTAPPSIVSEQERVNYRPPPGMTTLPPGGNPPGIIVPPDDPKGVPEPATIGIAAVGLAVLAVRWVRKRKK